MTRSKLNPGRALLEGDRYLALLAIVLLGYALMGKGFAYLGFPPLYVGEIAFLTGIVVFLRTGAFVGALATLPAVLLVALMAWVLARTLPFFGLYGFDSLRDSTIVIYGGFAFIVIGLLLEDARRINTVLRYYRIMLASFPAISWASGSPNTGWTTSRGYTVRCRSWRSGASAVGTHLAGTMVFVLIGYRKVSVLWIFVWFATLALVSATNRGATLAVLVPVVFAMLVLGRLPPDADHLLAAVGIFAVLLALEATFSQYDEAKEFDRAPGQRAPDRRECQEHCRAIRAAD